MAPLMVKSAVWITIVLLAASSLRSALCSSSICPHQSDLLINSLQSQCSISFPLIAPLEVDGDLLDTTLASKPKNVYTSILLHATWCPFSQKARSTFEVLSSMFPQIEHLEVEQSSAMPSLFSRYGIHSLPSILMVNQTTRVRFNDRKDLPSLVKFYKETTGLEPVQYFTKEHLISYGSSKKLVTQLSMKEIVTRDPCLVFSVLFLCSRMLLLILPKVMTFLKAIWISYVPHLNLDIFGETSQILGRLLDMTDLKRIWTKVRLCKIRNFHEGAKNARVWASSLASVSVGETSSARSSSSS